MPPVAVVDGEKATVGRLRELIAREKAAFASGESRVSG